MNIWSRWFACLALLGLALGTVVSAGDKEKADEKKPAKKLDLLDEKKDEKDDKKKEDKKKEDRPKEAEEKVVYGQVVNNAKIKRFASESTKDFVVEVLMPDPKKRYNFEKWKQDQLIHIASTDPKNPAERANRTFNYQRELAKRQANPLETHTPKDFEVRAVDSVKVRSFGPPVEYDDKGNLKKWTAKELAILKGKSKLPGYPVDYDALRPNQFVQLYMAKVDPPKGGTPKKKLLEDDIELGSAKPEVVMIVITGEAPR